MWCDFGGALRSLLPDVMKFFLAVLCLLSLFCAGCRTANADKSAANATVKRVEFRLGTNAAVVVSDPHDTSWKKLAFKSGDTELTIDGYRSTVNEAAVAEVQARAERDAADRELLFERVGRRLDMLDNRFNQVLPVAGRYFGLGEIPTNAPAPPPVLPSSGSTTAVRIVPAQ